MPVVMPGSQSSQRTPLPNRIKPDEAPAVDQSVLKTFKADIAQSNLSVKTIHDAHKVVECLRFIKVNIDFICYATVNRNDSRIYTQAQDKEKKVIRDHHNTSIHIFYSDMETCRSELLMTVSDFEAAIELCRSRGMLVDFIKELEYDEAIGCIDQRIARAMDFASRVSSSEILKFDDIMAKAAPPELQKLEESFYICEQVYLYFTIHGLWGTPCVYQNRDAVITKALVDDYLTKILSLVIERHAPMPIIRCSFSDSKKLIQEHFAIIKALPKNLENWTFLLNQIKDPCRIRPVKSIYSFLDRSRVFNAATGQMERRTIAELRGAKKQTPYTKKTATSLYPPHLNMSLFSNFVMALVFDLRHCDIKDKYIFKTNVSSDEKWWLGNSRRLYRAISLDSLRTHQSSRSNSVGHNEILSRLSLKALNCILTHSNHLSDKMFAIQMRLQIIAMFHIDVPIIIQTNQMLLEYSRAEQLGDLRLYIAQNRSYEVSNSDAKAMLATLTSIEERTTDKPSPHPRLTMQLQYEDLTCPITRQIMFEPVVCLPCSHVFEAAAIKDQTKCACCHREILMKVDAPAKILGPIESALRNEPTLYELCYFSHDRFAHCVNHPAENGPLLQRYTRLLLHAPEVLNESSLEPQTAGRTTAEILAACDYGKTLVRENPSILAMIESTHVRYALGDTSYETIKMMCSTWFRPKIPYVVATLSMSGLASTGYYISTFSEETTLFEIIMATCNLEQLQPYYGQWGNYFNYAYSSLPDSLNWHVTIGEKLSAYAFNCNPFYETPVKPDAFFNGGMEWLCQLVTESVSPIFDDDGSKPASDAGSFLNAQAFFARCNPFTPEPPPVLSGCEALFERISEQIQTLVSG